MRLRRWLTVVATLALLGSAAGSRASNCLGTSTGRIPLNDLGPGLS